mmetsp:Transcript_51436/g.60117  ORF Transcript_51436/g.60117 Transcript_51436/m.60117 type:complete len:85 (+) Transcript_51436:2-256(+)
MSASRVNCISAIEEGELKLRKRKHTNSYHNPIFKRVHEIKETSDGMNHSFKGLDQYQISELYPGTKEAKYKHCAKNNAGRAQEE